MRVVLSILAGFLIGFLLLGTGLEWLFDATAGTCTVECAGWRHWTLIAVTVTAWAVIAGLFYRIWGGIRPRLARSAAEERIRHLRSGGR